MSRFTLKPASDGLPAIEFEALDPAVALELAGRSGFAAGDILRDDVYLCTIRRAGERAGGGYWIVSQRKPEV